MSLVIRFGNAMASKAIPFDTRIRVAMRRCIAAEVERLIDMLDALDVDPDLEDGGDAEPSLGWTHTMALGSTDDGEIRDGPPE